MFARFQRLLMAIAIAVPWIVPSTTSMYIYALLVGIGYGSVHIGDLALMTDVLPPRVTSARISAFSILRPISLRSWCPLSRPPSHQSDWRILVIFMYAIAGVIISSMWVCSPIRSVK